MRTVWGFLENLKVELSYDPAIPLLGIYLEKNVVQKDIYTSKLIAAQFTTAKSWKQPKRPLIEEWIKRFGSYIQWNITQPPNEITPFAATCMI